MRVAMVIGGALFAAACCGCGTTKWSDTARTATEQLLICDSVDRAVSRLDLEALAGKKVFVDGAPIKPVTDSPYLLSAIRQQVLASGAILKDKREEADYVLEVRAAIGTDRDDVLFGIPATTLPTVTVMPTLPSMIPEVALAKKTHQRGVARISLFAYNRKTGRPVWQSGAVDQEGDIKALFVLGAGPFRRGTIHRGTTFAGSDVHIPLIDPNLSDQRATNSVSVADQAFFVEPKEPPAEKKKTLAAGMATAQKKAGTKGATPTAAATAPKAKDQATAAVAASSSAPQPNTPRPPDLARPQTPPLLQSPTAAPGDFRLLPPPATPSDASPAGAFLPLTPSPASG